MRLAFYQSASERARVDARAATNYERRLIGKSFMCRRIHVSRSNARVRAF